MTEKEALLQKIKALADRGEGGERESAAALLEKLMNKYGISEEELNRERAQDYFFPYSQETERRLLNQIIYMVTGAGGYGCVGSWSGRKRKKIGTTCTAAQKLEIEAYFAFYRAAMEKELEVFYSAFASKNGLYPPDSLVKPRDYADLTEEEIEIAARAGMMAAGMEKHHFRKQISDGTI